METLSLAVDIAVVVLLVATICYAYRLNRQLTTLRRGNGELQAAVTALGEASERAEAGIRGMRRAAQENGEALQKAIEKAQLLRDELSFMIESGDTVAGRIEGALARNPNGAAPNAETRGGHGEGQRGGIGSAPTASKTPAGRPAGSARDPARVGRSAANDRQAVRGAGAGTSRRVGFPEANGTQTSAEKRRDTSRDGLRSGARRSQEGAGETARAAGEASGPAADSAPETKSGDDRSGLSRAERELLEAIENRR